MADEMICIDTSVLIDYYRKQHKSKTLFHQLSLQHSNFAVSAITQYEILVGSNEQQNEFWQLIFSQLTILNFDVVSTSKAVEIFQELKSKRKLIEMPDILIAATAIANDCTLVTLNKKHFARINALKLL
ncbi:twitching motility protein PilT [Arachidicoccus ginsenosidimutans]|uniref:type II toxin-antitoxin system VapC family toxin n=1 Tax=Arachidicoccus sp. BS20 TaxID=1850526 RepID=UPI0007F0E245|nr:type II toxin-antitoxin system VapC family toxin [Arachidicoccus sp. BS20]ANI88917.1 twitching motility protein PilT [Arachidicoccus sp. BS20]